MGHSFGGSTALTAAHRQPQLARAVIAHEPATDWIPDDARQSLFPPHRLVGLEHNYSGGTGGLGTEDRDSTTSLHDHVHLLVMNSNEWMNLNSGQSHLLQEMGQQNRLGRSSHLPNDSQLDPANGDAGAVAVAVSGVVSRHVAVDGAHHTEFSDTSMLTPVWLARAVGLTGPRNPIDTAREIARHTRHFVRDVVAARANENVAAATTTK